MTLQNHILGELQKYEIWLPKEKRHRRGLKVSATIDEVNKRLPDLIAGLKPVYKKSEPLKAVSGGLIEHKNLNKANMVFKAKNNNTEVQAIIDSVNFMQQGIIDIKKSVNQDLEEVSNELVLLLDELEKINAKVA